jgi:uncharacterized membrane protein HdeD (DUF308 family)
MVESLSHNWWALALRGIVAILFGLFTFFVPGLTLLYLVILFGAYALLHGVFDLVAAFHHQAGRRWWVLALEGIVGIATGLLTFLWPGITAVALLYLISFWAIFTGILEIAAGIRLRKTIQNEWMFIIMGVLAVLFGMFILASPTVGALAIVIWVGAYALISGVIMLGLAFRLRSIAGHASHPGTPLPHAP